MGPLVAILAALAGAGIFSKATKGVGLLDMIFGKGGRSASQPAGGARKPDPGMGITPESAVSGAVLPASEKGPLQSVLPSIGGPAQTAVRKQRKKDEKCFTIGDQKI